ncbi:MAG: nucleoside triphosphate pyrophosphohydrolase [Candidatus Marsarchaeota archaeon]|nr:nucleoside triphosphate pyrophosphohydrolase [Candidatus Marsarchaeota archaeon]
MKYNKLIRDRLPEIMKREGKAVKTHRADDSEYIQKLKAKLVEEAAEYSRDENVEELADLMEVIYAVLAFKGVGRDAVEEMRRRKEVERGGFSGRLVLEEVT